jgi:hypothetical protein
LILIVNTPYLASGNSRKINVVASVTCTFEEDKEKELVNGLGAVDPLSATRGNSRSH